MQAQVSLPIIDSGTQRQQIKHLVIQNEDRLLNRFSGDRNVPKDKMLASLLNDITRRISSVDSIAEGVIDRDRGSIAGMVIGEIARWDTEQFDEKLGKIVLALFNDTVGLETRAMIVHNVVKRLGARMVSTRISLRDLRTIQCLESEGGVLTDVLLTYRFSFEGFKPILRWKGGVVDLARKGDESELIRLGMTLFKADRFHGDPHLPQSKSDEAYGKWVANSLHGLADAVLVARNGRHVIGFITCKIDESVDGGNFGVIDLVGVNPSYSGLGIGHDLVRSALDWFENRVGSVYVGTQASNSRAVRLYEGSGFKQVDSEATLHLWPVSPS